MIDGKNFFNQPVNSDMSVYNNIHKIATGQGDDYTTSCLLAYNNLKEYFKMIAIDNVSNNRLMLIQKQYNK